MRILVISAEALPGMNKHYFKDTIFGPSFAETEQDIKANTRLFSSWDKLLSLIEWSQVVIFGMGKYYQSATQHASQHGKIMVWQFDITGMINKPCWKIKRII